jgi:AraC-like DNA-binding protein
MLNVQYEAPNAELAALISSFYRLDFDGDNFAELERADRAQFRFQLRGQGEYHFNAGTIAPTYPVTIVGPTTLPVMAVAHCPLTIFGWGLTAAGWAALMGRSGETRVDTAFDAHEIFGAAMMAIYDDLAGTTDFAEQVEIAEIAATDIFSHCDAPPFEFVSIVDGWLLESVELSVDVLVQRTGLSQRQLERTTTRYYGMPPKKLARKYRALRAAHALAHGDSLDDSALGLAFYDQSHLIREVKHFTGLTPTQLRTGHSNLTRATMDGRRGLGVKVNSLISES